MLGWLRSYMWFQVERESICEKEKPPRRGSVYKYNHVKRERDNEKDLDTRELILKIRSIIFVSVKIVIGELFYFYFSFLLLMETLEERVRKNNRVRNREMRKNMGVSESVHDQTKTPVLKKVD